MSKLAHEIGCRLGYSEIDVDNALGRVGEKGGFRDEDERCAFALIDLIAGDEDASNWIALMAAAIRDAEGGQR